MHLSSDTDLQRCYYSPWTHSLDNYVANTCFDFGYSSTEGVIIVFMSLLMSLAAASMIALFSVSSSSPFGMLK